MTQRYENIGSEGNEPFAKLYQLVTCGNDSRVKLWEVKVMQDKCDTQPMTATIELCRIMEKHSSALTCVRFSSNGIYTASSGLDKTVVIWETVRRLTFLFHLWPFICIYTLFWVTNAYSLTRTRTIVSNVSWD